jgi:intracellular sulfur oxidation DsrE/DsrF family protein
MTIRTLIGAAAFSVAASVALAGETHHIAFHVDEGDAQVMNLTLNNAANVRSYYASKGEEVVIEIVTYGPGLTMLLEGRSPVADRLATMTLEMGDALTLSACGNTHKKMSEAAGTELALLDGVEMTPSGVVRLIELQEQGYAYVKP